MKQLKTIIREESRNDEPIYITTRGRLDSLNNPEWWKLDEYSSIDEVLKNYTGKEKVIRFWHEEGLCIILK